MARYIDADELREDIDNYDFTEYTDYSNVIDMIDDAPTADVEPVRHGRWIRGKNKSAFPAKHPAIWYCSCCGERIRYNDSMGAYQKIKKKVNEVNPRCRRCGAKMNEVEE